MVDVHDWLLLGDEVLFEQKLLVVGFIFLQDVIQVYLVVHLLLLLDVVAALVHTWSLFLVALHRIGLLLGILRCVIGLSL